MTITAGDWQVQSLQPLSEIKADHEKRGGSIELSKVVDLQEMGVPNGLVGTVTKICACPAFEGGPGRSRKLLLYGCYRYLRFANSRRFETKFKLPTSIGLIGVIPLREKRKWTSFFFLAHLGRHQHTATYLTRH